MRNRPRQPSMLALEPQSAYQLIAALGAAVLVGLSAWNCSGEKSAFERHVDAANRAYEQKDYLAATKHWKAAEGAAENGADRDEARYRTAMSLMRAGKVDEARAILGTLAKGGRTSRNGRAAFDLAFDEIKHGDPAKGHEALRDALVRYPDHGVARDALRRRRAYVVETAGSESAEDDLRSLAREVRGSELESTALYERAKLLEARGADEAALAAYLDVVERFPYPRGTYWNDATLAAAELERKLGRRKEARALLSEMLEHRESAALTGTYERAYDRATYLLGEIEADEGLWRASRERFLRLVADFETSRLRDDALWGAAVLSAKNGDVKTACELAARLHDETPESRFTECSSLVCAERPADANCSDYVRRAFDSGALRPEPTF